MQSELADDTTMNSVCIDDAASPRRIVGLSIVTRLGDGAAKISQLRAEMTERALVGGFTSSIPSASETDRSADLQAIAAFEANWEDVAHYFSGPRGECWLIDLFCVDPGLPRQRFPASLTCRGCRTWSAREPSSRNRSHIYGSRGAFLSQVRV